MNDYVLCGGSTVDLTCEYLKERNIEWIGFHFSIDDKEFVDDMGVNLSSADFYQAMRDGGETKTWQLNSEDYCEFFRPFLSDGKDIVYVCLSSGLLVRIIRRALRQMNWPMSSPTERYM